MILENLGMFWGNGWWILNEDFWMWGWRVVDVCFFLDMRMWGWPSRVLIVQ